MRNINPITPQEVEARTGDHIPDLVIEAFNELIVKNILGDTSRVLQKEVEERIMVKLDVSKDDILDRGYLDVEPLYRKAGWKVTYDKPAYDENYDAVFIFKRK